MAQSTGCPECRCILPGGRKCGRMALKDQPFCYAHNHRRKLFEVNRVRRRSVVLPPLEDRDAIQMSIDEVLAAFASSKITRREASTYLYAIDLAARNLTRIEQLTQTRPSALPPPPADTSSEPPQPPDSTPTSAENTRQSLPAAPQPVPPEPVPPEPAWPEAPRNLPSPPASPAQHASAQPPVTEKGANTPPPLSPEQLQERRRDLEEQLAKYRQAHDREAQSSTGAPHPRLAYLQQVIDHFEAELHALPPHPDTA